MHKFDNGSKLEDLYSVIHTSNNHQSIHCNNIETMNATDVVTNEGVESDLKSNPTDIMEATNIGKSI